MRKRLYRLSFIAYYLLHYNLPVTINGQKPGNFTPSPFSFFKSLLTGSPITL